MCDSRHRLSRIRVSTIQNRSRVFNLSQRVGASAKITTRRRRSSEGSRCDLNTEDYRERPVHPSAYADRMIFETSMCSLARILRNEF